MFSDTESDNGRCLKREAWEWVIIANWNGCRCISLDVPEETEADLLVGAGTFPFSAFMSHVNNYPSWMCESIHSLGMAGLHVWRQWGDRSRSASGQTGLSFAREMLEIPSRQTARRNHCHVLTDFNIKQLYENKHVGNDVWCVFCFIRRTAYAETSNNVLFGRGSQNCTGVGSGSYTESDIVARTDQAVHFIWESSKVFLGPKTLPRWGQYHSMKHRDPVSHWSSVIMRAGRNDQLHCR